MITQSYMVAHRIPLNVIEADRYYMDGVKVDMRIRLKEHVAETKDESGTPCIMFEQSQDMRSQTIEIGRVFRVPPENDRMQPTPSVMR